MLLFPEVPLILSMLGVGI
uniref:Uncharacterized protein n=1 Tax=Arundo donax TaxID=35708 RepID=A0A0A9A0G3_ARUDO